MFPSWINKKTISWSLYDFADTAFSALFITFFFPIYIKVHLGGNEFQIGLAMGISVLFAAFLVPFIGAMSDASGKRLPIIIWAAFATAVINVLVGYSSLGTALVLGFLAHITHLISKDVYDAKMIDLVPSSHYGALSGLGVAVGYMGTIASLGVAYMLMSKLGWESLSGIRSTFWTAGCFYVIFTIPMILNVPDKPRTNHMTLSDIMAKAYFEVTSTIKKLPYFPKLSRFLAASFLYNNAMNTTIIFLSLYGREVVGMGTQEFFPVFALMALAASVGSLMAGKASDRYGPVASIKFVLVVWISVILTLIFYPSYETFLYTGCIGGAALGSIWTLNRHMISKISPSHKIGELFGFEGLTEKFSGLFGPIVFGYLATQYNYAVALASVLLFFLWGMWVMRRL